MPTYKNFIIPNITEHSDANLASIDIFSKLLTERIIYVSGEIFDEMANVIIVQLLYLKSISKDPISMYINSSGGEIYSGNAILDTMDILKSEGVIIYTICAGCAASMAAVILSNGSFGYRKSTRRSRIMIHQPSSYSGDYSKSTEQELSLKEIQALRDELYKTLSDNTKQKISKIEKDCKDDKWFSADEAISYGLIDSIAV